MAHSVHDLNQVLQAFRTVLNGPSDKATTPTAITQPGEASVPVEPYRIIRDFVHGLLPLHGRNQRAFDSARDAINRVAALSVPPKSLSNDDIDALVYLRSHLTEALVPLTKVDDLELAHDLAEDIILRHNLIFRNVLVFESSYKNLAMQIIAWLDDAGVYHVVLERFIMDAENFSISNPEVLSALAFHVLLNQFEQLESLSIEVSRSTQNR